MSTINNEVGVVKKETAVRVWVTQEMSKFNYLDAENYGEVRFLTARDYSSMVGSLSNDALLKDIRDRLSEFNPETDYLVPTGSPLVVMVVMSIVARKYSTNRFKVLKWDNRHMKYIPTVMEL